MRGRIVWEAVWPWLFYELIASIVFVLYGWFFGEMGSMLIAMAFVLLLLLPLYFYQEYPKRTKKRLHTAVFFKLAGTAVCACLFFNLLLFVLGFFQRTGSYETVRESLFGGSFWFQLLAMGIAAPLTEELIYRGFLYGRLRRLCPIVPAVLLSSVCFAAAHGNLLQGIYTAFLGICLAFIYETDGLTASIWFHGWANLTAIVMNQLLGQPFWQETLSEGGSWPVKLCLVVSGLLLAVGMWEIGKKCSENVV